MAGRSAEAWIVRLVPDADATRLRGGYDCCASIDRSDLRPASRLVRRRGMRARIALDEMRRRSPATPLDSRRHRERLERPRLRQLRERRQPRSGARLVLASGSATARSDEVAPRTLAFDDGDQLGIVPPAVAIGVPIDDDDASGRELAIARASPPAGTAPRWRSSRDAADVARSARRPVIGRTRGEVAIASTIAKRGRHVRVESRCRLMFTNRRPSSLARRRSARPSARERPSRDRTRGCGIDAELARQAQSPIPPATIPSGTSPNASADATVVTVAVAVPRASTMPRALATRRLPTSARRAGSP